MWGECKQHSRQFFLSQWQRQFQISKVFFPLAHRNEYLPDKALVSAERQHFLQKKKMYTIKIVYFPFTTYEK